MPRCSYCGTTILFGGVKDRGHRFCNDVCHQTNYTQTALQEIPIDVVEEQTLAVHQGDCPKCGGPGPVDVHESYEIWSAFIMTSFKSVPHVCCRKCGIKAKFISSTKSGLFGWWGFPFGIIMTPIQIIRNMVTIFSSPDPDQPSQELTNLVQLDLADMFTKRVMQNPDRNLE